MGTVYEAEQENPRRRVALKVLRSGMVSTRMMERFAREAQILGRLHHPGIAQVYEAGSFASSAGREQPFFAMEFIEGPGLARFIDQMAKRVDGRVVAPELDDLGSAVVGSYLGSRGPGGGSGYAPGYRDWFGSRGFWAPE